MRYRVKVSPSRRPENWRNRLRYAIIRGYTNMARRLLVTAPDPDNLLGRLSIEEV